MALQSIIKTSDKVARWKQSPQLKILSQRGFGVGTQVFKLANTSKFALILQINRCKIHSQTGISKEENHITMTLESWTMIIPSVLTYGR